MKHASTRAVFAYWNGRRGNRPAPARSEIDPAKIAPALGDTFMLSADFADQLRFRLAGTRVCALFCREIKGEALTELWRDDNRASLDEVLSLVTSETASVVMGLAAHTEDGEIADLEMLLLPLARAGVTRTAVLGVLAPAAPVYWIGFKPVSTIEIKTVRHLGEEASARRFTLPEGIGAQHGFTVYHGGRAGESGHPGFGLRKVQNLDADSTQPEPA
jgi:hypothetical protein